MHFVTHSQPPPVRIMWGSDRKPYKGNDSKSASSFSQLSLRCYSFCKSTMKSLFVGRVSSLVLLTINRSALTLQARWCISSSSWRLFSRCTVVLLSHYFHCFPPCMSFHVFTFGRYLSHWSLFFWTIMCLKKEEKIKAPLTHLMEIKPLKPLVFNNALYIMMDKINIWISWFFYVIIYFFAFLTC